VFKREVGQNMLNVKENYRSAFPKEFTESPYEKFRLMADKPIDIDPGKLTTGSD